MFRAFKIGLVCLSLVLNASTAISQLIRSDRQVPIGNSDSRGFGRIDKKLYALPLGGGVYADIYIKFTTDPSMEPKYMGMYRCMPFFDSRVLFDGANRCIWKSPNNGTYTFNRLPKTERGWEESYILNTTGAWKLNKRGEDIEIENTIDAKHKYRFNKGILVWFCGGKESDSFKISYDGKGFPLSVYNLSKGRDDIRINYNSDHLISNIIFGSKKGIKISYADIVKGYKAVSEIIFSEGETEMYSYEFNRPQKRKYLTEKGKGILEVMSDRMMERNGKRERFIEWDSETGFVICDSGGEYMVRNKKIDSKSPEYDAKWKWDDARIEYKKPENKYEEAWEYSVRDAVKTTRNPTSGEETRTSYIGSPGKASMKVRKIEKRGYGEKDWNLHESNIYNPDGNLIRSIDAIGNIKEFIYNGNMLISKKENGIETFSRVYDGNRLIEEKEISNNAIIRRIFKGNLKLVIEENPQMGFTSYELYDGFKLISLKTVRKKNEK